MRLMTRGSVCACALLAVQALPVQAAPITVNLQKRLTAVCDAFPVDLAACTPDHTLVRFSITYDPDTLVLDLSDPHKALLSTDGPLGYDISLPALDDPWGGLITRESHASAEFEGGPLGSERAFGARILDWDHSPGCTPDGLCDRWWMTSLEFVNFFKGTPVVSPSAADFDAMFRQSGGAGSAFGFMTVAWYTPIGETEPRYLPGSRFYYSDIPEPQLNFLLAAGFTALGLLRRWRGGR